MMIQFWIILLTLHSYKMVSYCLKCKKCTKNINPQVSNTSNGKLMMCKNVQYLTVKNQDLLKNKKQKGY